ncbi:MAG: SUMF1/EgtB/PvdO family nonheme iron enzyme [Treponema sp.]|nr:SUMF1/EgtB/PvdO family nonheme iron enzyme [Treponema sp.]
MKKIVAILAALAATASVFASGAKDKVEVEIDPALVEMVQMVPVAGGRFNMGTADGEDDEFPAHSVSVDSFNMSTTEVTQELYKRIMGKNPSYFVGEKLPVEKVSWLDAIIFCNKLSIEMGKRPCYSQNANTDTDSWSGANNISCNYNANGYRLPTEAEWEFAARGGKNNDTFLYSGSATIDEVAWYEGNSDGETHEVATKAPNSLGLYDMSGNVWEWCWDNYSATFYVNGASANTRGPSEGTGKVLRGGSRASTYGDGSSVCRVTNRNSAAATERYYLNGFRFVNID